MTKYEAALRGGAPGSESRGMLIGSLASLAVFGVSWLLLATIGPPV